MTQQDEVHIRVKWVTSPHGRPRCPVHQVRLVAYTGHGPVGGLKCPVNGCEHREKCLREQVRDV